MNNMDVRTLSDEQLEVIAELALDFPDDNVQLIERVSNTSDSVDFEQYGFTISYMTSILNELYTLHFTQWQGLSVMAIDDEGYLDFLPTNNQFTIIDYIRNVEKNIVN